MIGMENIFLDRSNKIDQFFAVKKKEPVEMRKPNLLGIE
jgi:hypothetical protein